MTLKNHTTALMSACRLPETVADAPEWVHILPKGTVGTGDERGPYHYDPQKVIAASFAITALALLPHLPRFLRAHCLCEMPPVIWLTARRQPVRMVPVVPMQQRTILPVLMAM